MTPSPVQKREFVSEYRTGFDGEKLEMTVGEWVGHQQSFIAGVEK